MFVEYSDQILSNAERMQLTEVRVVNTEVIREYAFYNCVNLEQVNIDADVTT